MALFIQKFGGTSVGNIERFHCVADIILNTIKQGHQVVVVVSAMAGDTDKLIELAHQITENPFLREYDVLLSTGEQISMALLAILLHARGYPVRSFTGAQAGIKTDPRHGKAHIISVDPKPLQAVLGQKITPIVAGFQGITQDLAVTTLGRGGSDITAVALAVALQADECQIYTDVEGVYTSDPRVIPAARLLSSITLEEMLEMADLGAKVLQNRAVRYAGRYKIPLRVLSSFGEGQGTLITDEEFSMEKSMVSAIAFNRNQAQISLFELPFKLDTADQILNPLAEANIDLDIISQTLTQQGNIDFTFTVSREDYKQAFVIVEAMGKKLNAQSIKGMLKIVKLSVVGIGMRYQPGVTHIMLSALAKAGIAVLLISTSEIKISVLIDEKYLELGARTLHSVFDLDKKEAIEEFDPL